MRAIKLLVAICTILIGIGLLLGALAIIGLGFVFVAGLGILGTVAESVTDVFAQMGALFLGIVGVVLIVAGIACLIVGVLWLVLGVKFTSRKPNKGIAITLIVFYLIGSASLFDGIAVLMNGSVTMSDGLITLAMGGFCVLMVVFLILYLVLLGKRGSQFDQPQMQPTQYMQQPMSQPMPQQPPPMNFDPNTGQRLN